MAVINISPGDSIATTLTNADAGDEIVAAGGNYGIVNMTSTYTRSPRVVLRAASKTNKPTITGSIGMYFANVNGLTIDGFLFNNATKSGDQGYPRSGDIAIRLGTQTAISHRNVTIRNCHFIGYQRQLEINRGEDFILEYNRFEETGMDNTRTFSRVDRGRWYRNFFGKPRIDKTRYHERVFPANGKNRHPDNCQWGVPLPAKNGNIQAQGWRDLVIEENWMETWDDYQHNMLILNERWLREDGGNIRDNEYQGVVIRNNRIIAGHSHGLGISGGDYLVERNWISPFPPNAWDDIPVNGKPGPDKHDPTIVVQPGCRNTIIRDNSLFRAIALQKTDGVNGGTLSSPTMTNNTVTTTDYNNVPPPGWVDITNLVGPYATDDPDVSVPAPLESAYVTFGTVYDAGQIQFADGTFQGWSGTVIITDDSTAWRTAPGDIDLQWRAVDEGVSGWKPTRLGTPSTNAANSNRYDIRPDFETPNTAFPDAHRVHARKGGAITMTDVTLRWKPKTSTVYSLESTFNLSFTTPALGTAPNVSAVTLGNSAYTIGQTVTATFAYTLGTGTFSSLLVEWVLGSTVVSSQTLANGITTATTTASSAGSLSARVTLTTSVTPASVRSSTTATVTASPVLPDVTSVILNKSAYVQGEIATATATYTAGNGTGIAVTYQWKRDTVNIGGATSATYTTAALDVGEDLTCTVTATTSAGADSMTSAISSVAAVSGEPDPLAATEWEIAGVVSAPGLQNRFTAQWRMLITDTAVTGADWTTATVWRPCIQRGVDAQGRKLWELAPSATVGDQSHTVGYEETSAPILVRISTSTGTSDPTIAGKTFVGPAEPPILETELPAPQPSDLVLAAVPTELPGRFTGTLTVAGILVPADIASVQWVPTDGVWRNMVQIQTGVWRMASLDVQGTDHMVEYGPGRIDFRARYITAVGTSLPSETKSLVAPAPATPEIPYGEDIDGLIVSGVAVKAPYVVRPAVPAAPIAFVDPADAAYFVVNLPDLPGGATYLIGIYAGTLTDLTGLGGTWRATLSGNHRQGLLTAVSSAGVNSVSRVFNII